MPQAPYYDVELRPGDRVGVIDNRIAIRPAAFDFDPRDGCDVIAPPLAERLGVDWQTIRMHQCPCGALFIAPQTRRICNACRIERPRQRVRGRTARVSEARAEARAANCEQCGDRLTARRGTKRFCSTRCRMAHHRAQQGGISIDD